MLSGIELRPDFILPDLGADSDLQVIERLADCLFGAGMVRDTFKSAVLKREVDYCTGLAFPEMSVAIPHTDPAHVIMPCIAIAALREPVTFRSMGRPNVPCEVEMVFLLAITDPDTQVGFLTALIQAFREPGRLPALKACKTAEELTALFQSYFD